MRGDRSENLAWEAHWAPRAGIATIAAIALLVIGTAVSAAVGGDDKAEILRSAHEHSSSLVVGSLLQALGFALLIAPLVVLFRAAQARSERVRPQLIGLLIAAPLFFALATGINSFATSDAADQFVAGDARAGIDRVEAKEECESELDDKGAEEFNQEHGGGTPVATVNRCAEDKVEEETASNAIADASLASVATGFGLAGKLGLAIALFYTCLWGMRTGLLTRFWGSLGMALGVATLLGLVLFLAIFFVYIAMLLLGFVPGGRPPAWSTGEAIPWPTPGEKAAAELEPDEAEPEASGEESSADKALGGERRKRKQRD